MKYKKLIFAAVATFALAACGGGGGDDPGKDLFSVWKNETTGAVFDLSNSSFSTPVQYDFRFNDGARCFCDVTILGDQAGGKYIVDACIPVAASMRAQCNALQQISDYIKTHDALTLYTPNGPARFR